MSPATDPLVGSWTTTHVTESEFVKAFVAAGFGEKDAEQLFSAMGPGAKTYVTISVIFGNGVFTELESADGTPGTVANRGNYKNLGDGTFRLVTEGTEIYGYQIESDSLRLRLISASCGSTCGPPVGPTLYGSWPFIRSNQ